MSRLLTNPDLALPATIDDLTPEWLSAALGVEVTAAHQERIGEGVGLVGELARVHLTYADPAADLPATMVAKAHTRATDMLPIAAFYGLYTTEVGFYRDGASHFGIRVPDCYYADVSSDGTACVILLEDLNGSLAIDQIDGCPPERADVVIDALAALHGSNWNKESLKDIGWLRPFNNPAYLASGQMITNGLPVVAARYAGLPADALELGALYADNVAHVFEWAVATQPMTVSHTDLRLDNLFFDIPDGSPLAILDWQLTVRATGSYDVSYFICQSLTEEDRRAHEERLVRRWHDGLLAVGVTDYSFEKAWYDYRFGIAMQFAITAATGNYEVVNDHGARLVETIVRRHLTAVHEHGVLELFKDWLAEHVKS